MRLEDLPSRTVSLLDRRTSKTVDYPKPKVQRRKATPEAKPGLDVRAEPSIIRPGYYDVYEGLQMPRRMRLAIPPDCDKYYISRRRPWVSLLVGQSFFVPGSYKEKMRGEAGSTISRFMFVNRVPGTMVWRMK